MSRRSRHAIPALGPVGWSLANLGRWRELVFPSSSHLVAVSRPLSHRRDKAAFWGHEPERAGSLGVASFCQGCGARVRHLRAYGGKDAARWREAERVMTAGLGIADGFVECWEGLRMKVRPCGSGRGLLELPASMPHKGTSMALLLAAFLQLWGPSGSSGLE